MFLLTISSKALSRLLTTISLIFYKNLHHSFNLTTNTPPLQINHFKSRNIYIVIFIEHRWEETSFLLNNSYLETPLPLK